VYRERERIDELENGLQVIKEKKLKIEEPPIVCSCLGD